MNVCKTSYQIELYNKTEKKIMQSWTIQEEENPQAPNEQKQYLVYRLCNEEGTLVYFDQKPFEHQVTPDAISIILLSELEDRNIFDDLQEDPFFDIEPDSSYGLAQMTPQTLATLIDQDYYSVSGYSGDINDSSQLQALADHIMTDSNTIAIISAYLQKTIDYWALGSEATGFGTRTDDDNESGNIAQPGFDISDKPFVLATLYRRGWWNKEVGVHNNPGPDTDVFDEDRRFDLTTSIQKILYGDDVDTNELTDEEKVIYDFKTEILRYGGAGSEYIKLCNECVLLSVSAKVLLNHNPPYVKASAMLGESEVKKQLLLNQQVVNEIKSQTSDCTSDCPSYTIRLRKTGYNASNPLCATFSDLTQDINLSETGGIYLGVYDSMNNSTWSECRKCH